MGCPRLRRHASALLRHDARAGSRCSSRRTSVSWRSRWRSSRSHRSLRSRDWGPRSSSIAATSGGRLPRVAVFPRSSPSGSMPSSSWERHFAATSSTSRDLTSVLRVMALALVLRGLAIMPLALLQREMRFGPITAVELSGGHRAGGNRDRARARGRRPLEPRRRSARVRARHAGARMVRSRRSGRRRSRRADRRSRAHALRASCRAREPRQLRERELRGHRRRTRRSGPRRSATTRSPAGSPRCP